MADDDPLDPDADPFKPPLISTLVHCIHCNEEYDSYRMEWRIVTDFDGKKHGFWCCPIDGCGGAGFGFDIFPVDPNWTDEHGQPMSGGWIEDDDDEPDDGFFGEPDDDPDELTDDSTPNFDDFEFPPDSPEDRDRDHFDDNDIPF